MWDLFGALTGWITVFIGKFRSNNGYLEHNTSGTWTPASIICRKPRVTTFYTASSVTNTWYTVLNVASGIGRLNEIIFSASGQNETQMELEITIDGGTPFSYTSANSNIIVIPGDSAVATIGFIGPVEFVSSLLIRIRQTEAAATDPLGASVHYALI